MKTTLRRAAAYAAALSLAAVPLLAAASNGVAVFENPIKAESITELLSMLLTFFVHVATVLCVIYMIWSGFLFVKAQGNEKELETAKRAFFYALVGTILMLGAEVIATAISKTVADISGN
jgi:Type IV secretion system pilin